MCAVDYADPADVFLVASPRARTTHICEECQRTILAGETYQRTKSLFDGRWHTWSTCQHCAAAGAWMNYVCGGWLAGGLDEELREHWSEGYASILMGRLILGMRDRWHHGADPVPDVERIRAVAHRSMERKVGRTIPVRDYARPVETVEARGVL